MRLRIALLGLLCLFVACEAKQTTPPAKSDGPQTNSVNKKADSSKVELTVSVAASTKEIIEKLANAFAAKSGVKIKVNPGPSSGLANQIIEGANVDLFLSASREWGKAVADANLVDQSVELLTNELVIVVPSGNPAAIKIPQDLTSDRVKKIALAGENVPAGKYADQALTKLGLLEQLISSKRLARAQDVRGALSFVERGEAEAGIVYSTDVALTTKVEQVYQFEPSVHDEIAYVLVLLKHGSTRPEAREFFEYLQSKEAEAVYAQAGFRRWKPK